MKRWLFALLIVLVACAPVVQEQDVQEQPEPKQQVVKEIVETVVVQCWDGSTADSLEECPPQEQAEMEPESVTEVKAPENIAKQLLADAKDKFTGMAYLLSDRMVIEQDNKVRHYFLKMSELKDGTPITDVFIDRDKQEAVAYCNIEREGRMLDTSFDYQRSKCKNMVDKPIPVSFSEWNMKGPVEWLEEFSNLEPILVENNLQTISVGGNSKSIQPSLHYMVDGKRVILRIDRRYGVPIKIEFEGSQSIDFRETYFDTMVLNKKQEKITPDWVEYQKVSEYWLKGVQ